MAAATGVTATATGGVTLGAGLTTVSFALLDHRRAEADDAQTIGACTFHLGDGSHGKTPNQVRGIFILTYEQSFRYLPVDLS
jgi:hypothetical protein